MKPTIYTVHAYRWGDRGCHSYTVGVFGKKHAALKAAETEEDYRGGKYECEVLEWTLDSSIAGNHDNAAKVIKPLPAINTLKEHNVEVRGDGPASPARRPSGEAAPRPPG